MAKKPLDWSNRALAEVVRIVDFYVTEASDLIAEEAFASIQRAAKAIQSNPLHYREGKKQGTREYIVRRFPYVIIYRVRTDRIQIARVLHQAMRYFN